MVKLEDFMNEEVGDHSKQLILATIKEGKELDKTMCELIFNRYSLEVHFQKNEIVIYDDIFSEEEPLKMNFNNFLSALSRRSS